MEIITWKSWKTVEFCGIRCSDKKLKRGQIIKNGLNIEILLTFLRLYATMVSIS